MGTRSTLGPFAARPLGGHVTTPQPMSIFGGGPLEPIHRLEPGTNTGHGPHGLVSRSAVSMGGHVAAAGGWPGPIIRQARVRFGHVLPGPVPVVNLIVGVPSKPVARSGGKRRGR